MTQPAKPVSATPQPLSDEELSFVRRHETTVCCCEKAANHVSPKQAEEWGEPERINEARWLATIDALKAQPAPVSLAEDEALIAEAARNCQDNFWASGLAERLSLRSGQLAQVLALRDWANDAKWLRMIADGAELLPDNPDGVGTCEISAANQWLWPETRDNLIDIAEKIDGIRAIVEGDK